VAATNATDNTLDEINDAFADAIRAEAERIEFVNDSTRKPPHADDTGRIIFTRRLLKEARIWFGLIGAYSRKHAIRTAAICICANAGQRRHVPKRPPAGHLLGAVGGLDLRLQTVQKRIVIRTVAVQEELISMTKTHLKLVTPDTEKRTVTPRRRPNAELRTREYLTDREVALLQETAKGNRWGHRDATMILVAYRHGLRAIELVDLRWDQIDFETATMAVRRAKKGTPSTHPIRGDELRALRRLQREQDPKSPFVFTSERGSPFTTAGFARMVERAGEAAELGFKAHPHMLRHATGFALKNKGHDTRALQGYLGHRNIQHTVRYTELSPDRFKDFWR